MSVSMPAAKAASHENTHHSFEYYQTSHDESELQFMTPDHDVTDILEYDVDLVYLNDKTDCIKIFDNLQFSILN